MGSSLLLVWPLDSRIGYLYYENHILHQISSYGSYSQVPILKSRSKNQKQIKNARKASEDIATGAINNIPRTTQTIAATISYELRNEKTSW